MQLKLNFLIRTLLCLTLGIFTNNIRAQSNNITVNDELLYACKNMDTIRIEALIRAGANVNYTKAEGIPLTPLLVSSIMGDSDGVKLLLRNGAKPSSADDNTALSSACMFGFVDVIRLLVEGGATFDSDATECIHNLILKVPPELRWLLIYDIMEEGDGSDFPTIDDDEDLIQLSLSQEDRPYLEAIEYLLQKKFPPNLLNEEGSTALDVAIERKHIPFIQRLTAAGFVTKTQQFETADLAIFAAAQNNIPLLKSSLEADPTLLNRRGSTGQYAIIEAFRYRSVEAVKLLVSKSVLLDVTDSDSNNILHYASLWDFGDLNEQLLPALKNLVNQQNKEGFTPAMLAAVRGHEDLFKRMRHFTDFADSSFKMVVHDMLELNKRSAKDQLTNGQLWIVEYLLQKKVFIDGVRNYQSALQLAVHQLEPSGNNLGLIKALVDAATDSVELNSLAIEFAQGFDISFLQALGGKRINRGLLMNACVSQGKMEMVRWLLAQESSVENRNKRFHDALAHAILENNIIATRLLLEAGIDPNLKNPYGYRPLDYAILKEDDQLCLLLIEHGALLEEVQLNSEVVARLSNSNSSNMKLVFGVMMLKNQLVPEEVAKLAVYPSAVEQEIARFEQNQQSEPQPQKLKLDQQPRFWDIFPYTGSGTGGWYSNHAYYSHKQDVPYWVMEKQQAWKESRINVDVSDFGHLPAFDFGSAGSTQARKLKTSFEGSVVIPGCTYDPARPICYPGVTISNNYFSNEPVIVKQPGQSEVIINPGNERFFDRSAGELTVDYKGIKERDIHINLRILTNIGPMISINPDTKMAARLQTYSRLNEVRKRIQGGGLSASELRGLNTEAYMLALIAVEQGYNSEAQSQIVRVVDELNKVEHNISKLYQLLFNGRAATEKDKVLWLVRTIIQTGNLSSPYQESFRNFQTRLSSLTDEASINQLVSRLLQEEIFVAIERRIFELQFLMLEAAQFLNIAELEHRIDYVHINFKNKLLINPTQMIINEADLNGKGTRILSAFKN